MVFVDRPLPAEDGDPDAVAAAERLLAHRRAQRGRPTPGDEADRAFLAVLRALPLDARTAATLRAAGERAGREVYAKLFVDAPLAHALRLLGEGLAASGMGRLHVEDAFHRTARLRHDPADAPAATSPYVEGAVRGFLSECYNCDARVQPLPGGRLDATLGQGRDVNGGRRA